MGDAGTLSVVCFSCAYFSRFQNGEFFFCVTKGVNPAYDPWIFLIVAGDVEQNPGPVCVVCSRGVRAGQTPLRCAGCGVECHRQRACSGLSRGAQSVGRWHCAVCLQGMSGVAADVDVRLARDRTGSEGTVSAGVPRRAAPVGRCCACQAGIRSGTTPLVCSGCGSSCHRQHGCSGLSRAQQALGVWACRRCLEEGSASPTRPVATVAGAVVGEEVGASRVGTARGQREPCRKCGKGVPPCRRPLRCCVCDRAVHKQCSGLSRGQLADPGVSWRCGGCDITPPADDGPRRRGPVVTAVPGVGAGGQAEFHSRGHLRILQWNADGIATRVQELDSFLREHRVDICLLQESKLLAKDRTPSFEGYTVVRQDRPSAGAEGAARGGGLLTLIRRDVPFRRSPTVCDVRGSSLEALSVDIREASGQWLSLVNVYCPPIRSSPGEERMGGFDPSILPSGAGC